MFFSLSDCYKVFTSNRPFPSSKKSHFQNEAKCETFVVKMSFICIIIKNHFHINSFALSLALKVRFFGTRKWSIAITVLYYSLARKNTVCLVPSRVRPKWGFTNLLVSTMRQLQMFERSMTRGMPRHAGH